MLCLIFYAFLLLLSYPQFPSEAVEARREMIVHGVFVFWKPFDDVIFYNHEFLFLQSIYKNLVCCSP